MAVRTCAHGRLLTKTCWRCTFLVYLNTTAALDGKEESMKTDHGTVVWTLFSRGVWPRCKCGYDPHNNELLALHYAEYGFREVDDHGQIKRFAL